MKKDNRAIHEVFSRVIQCIWFLTHLLLLLSIAFEIHNFADGKGEVRTCQFQMTWQPSAKNSIYLLRKTSFKRHYYFRAVVFLEWTRLINFSFHLQRNVLVWHFTSGWLDLYKSWKKGHTSSYQKELFYFPFHLLFYYGRNNDFQKKMSKSPKYLCKLVPYVFPHLKNTLEVHFTHRPFNTGLFFFGVRKISTKAEKSKSVALIKLPFGWLTNLELVFCRDLMLRTLKDSLDREREAPG